MRTVRRQDDMPSLTARADTKLLPVSLSCIPDDISQFDLNLSAKVCNSPDLYVHLHELQPGLPS